MPASLVLLASLDVVAGANATGATGSGKGGPLQPRLTQGFARAMQELWAG